LSNTFIIIFVYLNSLLQGSTVRDDMLRQGGWDPDTVAGMVAMLEYLQFLLEKGKAGIGSRAIIAPGLNTIRVSIANAFHSMSVGCMKLL
jgi:hypothetical protein